MNKSLLLGLCILFLLVLSLNVSAIDTSKATAYYTMNNSGNMTDVLAKGYNLTEYGTIPQTTGKYNGSRGEFSSTNYFKSTTYPSWNYNNDWSISFWINRSSDCTAGAGNRDIIDYGSTTGNFRIELYCDTDQTLQLYLSKFGQVAYNKVKSVVIPKGVWVNVVATYNSSGTVRALYVGGAFQGNATDTISGTTSHTTLTIGKDANNIPFTGSIDDFVWWNTTLSTADILIINNSVISYPYTGIPSTITFNADTPLNNSYSLISNPFFNGSVLAITDSWNITLFVNNTNKGTTTVSTTGGFNITSSSITQYNFPLPWFFKAIANNDITNNVNSSINYILIANQTNPQGGNVTTSNCVINVGGNYLVPDGCYSTY